MKKRVLFLSVATHLGGGERSMLDLVRSLAAGTDYSPIVILPKSGGELEKALKQAKVDVQVVDFPPAILRLSRNHIFSALGLGLIAIPEFLRYLWRLRNFTKAQEVSLIHTNGIKCHLIGTFLGFTLRKPVLWHLRDILRPGPLTCLLRALQKNPLVGVVANSQASLNSLGETARSWVVFNGFSEYTSEPIKNPWGDFGKKPVVAIVGMLARWKGQDFFLKLADALTREGRDLHFAIIGGKIYDTDADEDFPRLLEEQVKGLGLSERVRFCGLVSEPREFLTDTKLIVHCSMRPEPFGRVIIEAWQSGAAVVATKAGGILEFVQNEQDALLYPIGDLTKASQAVGRILDDEALRTRLIQNGRRKAKEDFSLAAHRDAIYRVYASLLAH